jgi:acyl-CoA dehydrogenase
MSSLATQAGDGYRLTGRKVFISGAADADRMLAIARAQKASEVERRTEGISLFVVDTDAPGVELQPLNIDVGWPERQYLVFFDDVELDAGRLIGQPGQAGAHANMAKLLDSRAAVKAVEAALQMHGGCGFDKDYDVITLWPSARLMEIAPINNEMLLNYIGEHVLGLPKSY